MSEVGPLVVQGGLTSAVHGLCTPLGIRKLTVYLAGFDLGAHFTQTHQHKTKHPYKVVVLDLSSLGSDVHSQHYMMSGKHIKQA